MARAPTAGGTAYTEVTDHIDFVTRLAMNATADVTAYIEELNDLIDALTLLPAIATPDEVVFTEPGNLVYPEKPDLPTPIGQLPTLPAFPSLDPIHNITLNPKPEYTAGDAPGVTLPGVPGPLDATAPDDVDVETDFDFPTAPTPTLPTVPTMETITLPDAPTITLPTFSETLPDVSGVTAPGINFAFDEDIYTSDLLTDVSALLVSRLQGGTGLPVDIEQAIWDRARNREDVTNRRTIRQISVENASKGWSQPPGSMLDAVQQATQEVQGKVGDLSREIAIKQAEMEQKNLEMSINQTLQLETLNMNYIGSYYGRVLDSQKFLQQTIVEIFEAQVKQKGLEIDAYKAYAVAFETRLKGALADLEVYKSELEAQQLIGTINEQYIKVYLGQLEGVKTEMDVYKTTVEAISEEIKAQNLIIANYKAQLDGFLGKIKAKSDEYGLYESKLKAAYAPLDVYDRKVNAYAERIKAYGEEAKAEKNVVDADISGNEMILSRYKTQLDGISSQMDAVIKQYGVDATIYGSAVDMYEADLRGEGERFRSEAAVNKNKADVHASNAQIQIANSQLLLKKSTDQIALAVEIIKKQSEIGSQLAAAALSSMNVGANIGANNSQSWSYNFALDDSNF